MRLSDRYVELMKMDKEEVANIVTDLEDIINDIEEMCKYDCEYECSNDSSKCGICSCLEQRIQRRIKQAKEGNNGKM